MISHSVDIATEKTAFALVRLSREFPTAYANGVYLFGAHVLTKAMRYTPVATGRLRISRWIAPPELDGTRFQIQMGFSAYYAAAVHDREIKYKVGRRLFLTSALDEEKSKAPAFVVRVINKLIKTGQTPLLSPLHPIAPLTGPQEKYKLSRKQQKRTGGIGWADRYRRGSRSLLGGTLKGRGQKPFGG